MTDINAVRSSEESFPAPEYCTTQEGASSRETTEETVKYFSVIIKNDC